MENKSALSSSSAFPSNTAALGDAPSRRAASRIFNDPTLKILISTWNGSKKMEANNPMGLEASLPSSAVSKDASFSSSRSTSPSMRKYSFQHRSAAPLSSDKHVEAATPIDKMHEEAEPARYRATVTTHRADVKLEKMLEAVTDKCEENAFFRRIYDETVLSNKERKAKKRQPFDSQHITSNYEVNGSIENGLDRKMNSGDVIMGRYASKQMFGPSGNADQIGCSDLFQGEEVERCKLNQVSATRMRRTWRRLELSSSESEPDEVDPESHKIDQILSIMNGIERRKEVGNSKFSDTATSKYLKERLTRRVSNSRIASQAGSPKSLKSASTNKSFSSVLSLIDFEKKKLYAQNVSSIHQSIHTDENANSQNISRKLDDVSLRVKALFTDSSTRESVSVLTPPLRNKPFISDTIEALSPSYSSLCSTYSKLKRGITSLNEENKTIGDNTINSFNQITVQKESEVVGTDEVMNRVLPFNITRSSYKMIHPENEYSNNEGNKNIMKNCSTKELNDRNVGFNECVAGTSLEYRMNCGSHHKYYHMEEAHSTSTRNKINLENKESIESWRNENINTTEDAESSPNDAVMKYNTEGECSASPTMRTNRGFSVEKYHYSTPVFGDDCAYEELNTLNSTTEGNTHRNSSTFTLYPNTAAAMCMERGVSKEENLDTFDIPPFPQIINNDDALKSSERKSKHFTDNSADACKLISDKDCKATTENGGLNQNSLHPFSEGVIFKDKAVPDNIYTDIFNNKISSYNQDKVTPIPKETAAMESCLLPFLAPTVTGDTTDVQPYYKEHKSIESKHQNIRDTGLSSRIAESSSLRCSTPYQYSAENAQTEVKNAADSIVCISRANEGDNPVRDEAFMNTMKLADSISSLNIRETPYFPKLDEMETMYLSHSLGGKDGLHFSSRNEMDSMNSPVGTMHCHRSIRVETHVDPTRSPPRYTRQLSLEQMDTSHDTPVRKILQYGSNFDVDQHMNIESIMGGECRIITSSWIDFYDQIQLLYQKIKLLSYDVSKYKGLFSAANRQLEEVSKNEKGMQREKMELEALLLDIASSSALKGERQRTDM